MRSLMVERQEKTGFVGWKWKMDLPLTPSLVCRIKVASLRFLMIKFFHPHTDISGSWTAICSTNRIRQYHRHRCDATLLCTISVNFSFAQSLTNSMTWSSIHLKAFLTSELRKMESRLVCHYLRVSTGSIEVWRFSILHLCPFIVNRSRHTW